MSLLACQQAFRAAIAAPDGPPRFWPGLPDGPGMAVYRDAYRGRLLAALGESFARTRQWAGDESFNAAACHYILSTPPRGWSLDDYGADFPDLLAGLFTANPEVADLAWLEWRLQQAFAAPDRPELATAQLAAAVAADEHGDSLGFAMAAGFALRMVRTDCVTLWEALRDGAPAEPDVAIGPARGLVVWRSGLSPHYRLLAAEEAAALARLAAGEPLGRVAPDHDPVRLGQWLGQWLGAGLFAQLMVAG